MHDVEGKAFCDSSVCTPEHQRHRIRYILLGSLVSCQVQKFLRLVAETSNSSGDWEICGMTTYDYRNDGALTSHNNVYEANTVRHVYVDYCQ